MSEQAKLTYLQEKIKEARFMGRLGWIIFILGGAVVGIGFLSYEKTGELSILGFGIFLSVIGLVINIYYGHQKDKFMEELRLIATT